MEPGVNKPPAMLAIWHDVRPDAVPDYLRWHTFEHLPERLALPGFQHALRLELESGPGQRFLCILDVENVERFASSAYLERLNAPTPWTRRLMPAYGKVHRALCQTLVRAGTGVSPYACCLRFNLAADAPAGDVPAPLRDTLDTLHKDMQIESMRLGIADTALSAQRTEESILRRKEDTGGFDYVLVIGGVEPVGFRTAATRLEHLLAGLSPDLAVSYYRFSYAASA